MKPSVKQRIQCPCCGEQRERRSSDPPLVQEKALAGTAFNPWWATPGWTLATRRDDTALWACRECLTTGRAIEANPALQLFCDCRPYLAYFDTFHTCVDCQNGFVFPKEEQRFWYEELGFWVQSRPTRCRACRAKRRANTEVQKALAVLDPACPAQLAAVAKLHLKAGHQKKAIEYLRRAKNRAATPEQRAELIRTLEEVEQTRTE